MEIVIQQPYVAPKQTQIITIEQWQKKRVQRRRRVAKRMLKRFPLFAVEEMHKEFPTYDLDTFITDVTRKTRKGKSFHRIKSPMVRQGRYWEMQKMLSEYNMTGNVEFLYKAQKLRNNMYLPFEIDYRLKREVTTMSFPSYCPLSMIRDLTAIKFTSWEELETIIKEKTRYGYR
jgi:hypothetical protein